MPLNEVERAIEAKRAQISNLMTLERCCESYQVDAIEDRINQLEEEITELRNQL